MRGDWEKNTGSPAPPGRWRRLAWFVGLWIAGVTTLGAVAAVIRWIINSQFPH